MIPIIKEFGAMWWCVGLIFLQAAFIHYWNVHVIATKRPYNQPRLMHALIIGYWNVVATLCPFVYKLQDPDLMTALSQNYHLLVATDTGTMQTNSFLCWLLVVWVLHITWIEDLLRGCFPYPKQFPIVLEMLQGCSRFLIMGRGSYVLVTSNLLNGNNPPTAYQNVSSRVWGGPNPSNNQVPPEDVIALVVLLLMSWWFQNAMFRVMNPVALVVEWGTELKDGENIQQKLLTLVSMCGGTLAVISYEKFASHTPAPISGPGGLPDLTSQFAKLLM
jgi:hypothetical protein